MVIQAERFSGFYDNLGRLNLLIFYSVPKVCRASMTDWFNRKTLRPCAGAFTLSGISYRVHTSLLLKCFIIVCYCYNLEIMKTTEKQFLGTTQARINGDLSAGSPEEHCTQCM